MADTLKICYRSPVSGNSNEQALQLLTRLYKGNEKKARQVIENPGATLKTFTDRDKANQFITRLSELGIICFIDPPASLVSDNHVEDVEPGFDFVSSITCPHCGAQQEKTINCRECGRPVSSSPKSRVKQNVGSGKKPRHLNDPKHDQPGSLKASRLALVSVVVLVLAAMGYLGMYFFGQPASEARNIADNELAEPAKNDMRAVQTGETGSSVADNTASVQYSGAVGQTPVSSISMNTSGKPEVNLDPFVSATADAPAGMLNLPSTGSAGSLQGDVLESPDSVNASMLENLFADSIDVPSTSTAVIAKGDHMSQAQPVFSADKVDIPSPLMKQIQGLDPLTDSGWEKKAVKIMKALGSDERKFVYSQHLEPKGIKYQSAQRRFIFDAGDSLQDVIRETQNVELRNIGNKLTRLIGAMGASKIATRFADQIEGAVDLVNSFDTREELSLQKEKNRLRKALFSELVSVIRKAQFEVERNPRALSVAAVQNFIIEVYIKHQLLGYRFRTLPIGTLEQDPRPFVRDVIASQARLRQCDIIKTDSLLYLIAPVKDARQNPYSVRRFLSEESLLGGSFVYFNGVIIDINKRIEEERYRNGITRILDRIVTLERQLSDNIVNLVRQFDEFHEQTLKPMVTRSLEADGSAIGLSIDSRMEDFEEQLEKEILTRIDHAIVNVASTNDDYEYLFFSLRRILIELAAEVRDFASDAAVWSQRVEITELKIIALLHLLDKRKAEIFTSVRSEEIDPENEPTLLLKELHFSLKKYGAEISQLNIELRESLDHQEAMNKTGFKAWLQRTFSFKGKSNQLQPDDLRKKIQDARKKCFLELIRTFKQYPKIRIYMEFEEVTPVIDGIRHYAIAQGIMGVSELPMMLRLQENANAFDIGAITKVLTPRIKAR